MKALVIALLLPLAAAAKPTDWVNPFIGTDGTGHVTPAAVVPFGMVMPGPDNADRGWDFSSGYQLKAPRILGFSNSHISGAGIPELGDVLLQPAQGRRWSAATTDFSAAKSQERARPGFYAVRLRELGVQVALTATSHVAVQRYTFDQPGRVQLLVDLQHNLNFKDGPTVTRAETRLNERGATGTLWRSNWVDRQVSFALQFSAPIRGQVLLPAKPGELAPRWLLDFDLGAGRVLEARVALSTVDEAGAAGNLATAERQRFEAIKGAADAAWNDLLGRVEWQTRDPRQRRILTSALYRCFVHPSQIADVDGRVRGPRGEVMQAPGGVYYSTLSLWDTFRAVHPLLTLLAPERVPGLVNSLIAHQQQQGYLPLWTAWGRETHTMIGNPAMPVVADALAKGLPGIDAQAALAAMLATSTEERPTAPEWAQRDWRSLERYGYLPFDVERGESVSRTAEYGYGDAALAQVAAQLGQAEVAARFRARAAAWQQLFDPATRTLRGKDSAGAWRQPFDPLVATSPLNNPGDYTEANAWQYTATPALHDPLGFRDKLGGPKALEDWLDRFFSLPIPNPDKHLGQEALIGQYAHGNEPSHHIAWLYAFTDAPEKGHARVAEIARRFYTDRPDGIVGNDDCGQMSAWLVFAALGLYPVEPFAARYVTGSPLWPARLQLGQGRTLSVSGRGLQAVLDGAPQSRTGIAHTDLVKARRLVFMH